MQGSDQMLEIDELGAKLSIMIGCAVHYPAFGKNLFECNHGVIFPIYVLKGNKPEAIIERHNKEKVMADA